MRKRVERARVARERSRVVRGVGDRLDARATGYRGVHTTNSSRGQPGEESVDTTNSSSGRPGEESVDRQTRSSGDRAERAWTRHTCPVGHCRVWASRK